MNLGELQAALKKALAEGASKTDTVYLSVHQGTVWPVSGTAHAVEVDEHITDRKPRSVVIKGW